MGERKVLRVSGRHGGNLWMMVSPTVTERGSVFQVGRLSLALSLLSLCLLPSLSPAHAHTHHSLSLTHTTRCRQRQYGHLRHRNKPLPPSPHYQPVYKCSSLVQLCCVVNNYMLSKTQTLVLVSQGNIAEYHNAA